MIYEVALNDVKKEERNIDKVGKFILLSWCYDEVGDFVLILWYNNVMIIIKLKCHLSYIRTQNNLLAKNMPL